MDEQSKLFSVNVGGSIQINLKLAVRGDFLIRIVYLYVDLFLKQSKAHRISVIDISPIFMNVARWRVT